MTTLRFCPYCGSPKIEPYKEVAYKCLACGRVFITPIEGKSNPTPEVK